MRPKVELEQIRNSGEIVDDSILLFKQNWQVLLKSYFYICGFFWVAGILISIFNQTEISRLQEKGESIYSATYFLSIFFGFINFTVLLLTILSFISLYHEKGNKAPTVEEVWSYVKFYFLRVFSSSILLVALLAAGAVCCVLPGIYFMPIYALIITIMILENATLGYAFGHSFRLIKDNWWHTFGVVAVMGMIVLAATILLLIPVSIIVAIVLAFTHINQHQAITMVIAVAASSFQFLYLLPVISLALVYYDLNQRMDDNSLYDRIEMLGRNTTQNNDELPTEEY